MNVSIKDMPEDDRPRERLIQKGKENLSNEELLAILINVGYKNISSKALASQILKKYPKLEELKDVSLEELIAIKGVGKSKACNILAAIELSRRINLGSKKIIGTKFTSPDLVFNYFKDRIDQRQEQFFCLYLDSSQKIIKDKKLFVGTVNRSMVHPRDIFKEAYKLNASSIICMHNHPSDNIEPSIEDENLTYRIKEISMLMGINFLDHIIIGKTNYYSFMENGKL